MNYETAQDLYDALSEPFPIEYIQWRVGPTNERNRKEGEPIKGQPLCYIDARCVMDRLDSSAGPDGWSCNYTPGVGASIVCNISIRMPESKEWVSKADGAGASDMEAEKGALSDAFKRAAVRWGIGRYLYDLHSPWIELQQRGKSTIIPDAALKNLNELHEDFAQKAGWGLRAGVQAYKLLNQMVKQTVTSADKAQEFQESQKSMIAQLPVGMRRHLFDTLARVGAPKDMRMAG